MKGFLSLLGITLIVGAFGLISLSFYGNPLEELNSQERMQAYMETRQTHSIESFASPENAVVPISMSTGAAATIFSVNKTQSCEKPSHK